MIKEKDDIDKLEIVESDTDSQWALWEEAVADDTVPAALTTEERRETPNRRENDRGRRKIDR